MSLHCDSPPESPANMDLIDNETQIVSMDYADFEWFNIEFRPVYKYLCTVLCILGIVANGITIVVLTRPRMNSTANGILTLIAASDFVSMVSSLIYLIYSRFLTFKCEADEFSHAWMSFTLFHANLCVFSKAASLWLAVILAGYRRRLLGSTKAAGGSGSKMAIVVGGCTGVVLIFCVPMFVQNKIVGDLVPDMALGLWCPNGTMYYQIKSIDYDEGVKCFLTKFVFWITGLVFKFLPCCLLAYCLVWIIVLMVDRSKRRAKQLRTPAWKRGKTLADKSTHRTTLILTVILSLTLMCELPCAIVSVMAGVFSRVFFELVYRNLGDFFDALSLFNGITTFPLYCFMSAGFRNTFLQLFSRCRKNSSNNNNNNNNNNNQLKLFSVTERSSM